MQDIIICWRVARSANIVGICRPHLCFNGTIQPISQSERQQVLPIIRLIRRGNNTSPTFNNLLGESNAPGFHFIIGTSRDAIIRRRNRRQTSTIWVPGATLLPYLLLRRLHLARRITFSLLARLLENKSILSPRRESVIAETIMAYRPRRACH